MGCFCDRHRPAREPNLSRACAESLHNMPMTKHFSATLAVLALFAVVPALTAQTKGFVPGKTPDGQPDLRGMWVNFDSTPFEAPAGAGVRPAAPIPNDGRPRLGDKIRQWDGEPRGHWEGTTLVVESSNYNDKGMIATSAATQRIRGIPQTEALHVVERFTPVDPNTIIYRATVEDKNVYTKPWTVEIPLTRDSKYRIFEYSCKEGNYATPNILAGGRNAERDTERATRPQRPGSS